MRRSERRDINGGSAVLNGDRTVMGWVAGLLSREDGDKVNGEGERKVERRVRV